MLTDLIARLRPAGTTSADISAAMNRARAAQAEADAAVAKADQEWQAALLDASMDKLKQLEAKLAEARTEAAAVAARVAAVLTQLEQRFAATRRAEVLALEADARKAAEDAGRALASKWAKSQPKLHELLQELARLDRDYADAQYEWQAKDRAAREAYPDVAQQNPTYTGEGATFWQDSLPGMAELPRPPRPELVPTAEELEQKADLERRRAEAAEEVRQGRRLGYGNPGHLGFGVTRIG